MISAARRPISAPSSTPIPRCPPPLQFGTPLMGNAKAQLKTRAANIQKSLMVGRFTEAGHERAMSQLKFIKSVFVGGDLKNNLIKGAGLKVSNRIDSLQNTLMTARFADPSIRASYEAELKFLQKLQVRTAAR